jgi:hypothetical protein
MDMTIIQVSVVCLAVLMAIKTAIDFKKNRVTLPIFIFWTILWLAIIAVAVLPQVTGFLDEILAGQGRGLDAIVYLSIFSIFFIIFKIIAKLERLEREITAIVRHLAIKDPKKK